MTASSRLLPSLDLARRVGDAAFSYSVTRLQVLERLPGNPLGVAFKTLDGATALMARRLPSPSFNSVFGLRAGQTRLVEPLVEWYREAGATARFEIAAGDHDASLGRELARLGFFQSDFHAALVGEADVGATPDQGAVAQVTGARDLEDFLAAYVAGWGVPSDMREGFKANVRGWLGEPGWLLYLARVEGRPAGAAILFVRAGVGYFADCAVDPQFRRRGLHAALLRRRLADAKAAGVDFVCSGADLYSASHRNMERAGMRLLFLRAIWTATAASERSPLS